MDYVHQKLGEEVQALAGYYTPLKELRIQHDGREVLAVIGTSTVESACCGGGSCSYAIVPGYIQAWHGGTNDQGLPVSQVAPVSDPLARRDVARTIRESEHVQNIDLW